MEKDTIDYIKSWNKKLELINKDDLNSLFDKFYIIYQIYNRFYNDIYRENPTEKRIGDFVKATVYLVDNIGADLIIERTLSNSDEIRVIAKLIKDKVFHINLADGIPQEATDEQLAKNLLSNDKKIKARAILSVIYNVRANIVHSEKHFKEYQRLLLEPVIQLMETIVEIMNEKLN